MPEAEDEGLYDGYPLPHPPSFNQADVSEMPTFIRDKPLLTGDEIDRITQHYRCALEALHGVDRGIGEIYDAVAAAGELNKTIFVFTSDNGYFYGEHRIIKGKPYPYAENINMPLTIRVPLRYRDEAPLIGNSDAPVANIDLAPTLLELAGGKPCRAQGHCRVMDGRSLMPLIEGTGEFPSTRGIGLERYSCDFRGVRWGGSIYVSYSLEDTVGCQPAEAEMYDLAGRSLPAQRPAADDGGHAQRRAAGQAGPQDAPARRLRRHPRPRPEADLRPLLRVSLALAR